MSDGAAHSLRPRGRATDPAPVVDAAPWRRATDPARAAALRRLERVASLMDDRFKLPLVGTRVGLDPLLGLIPGVGDWVTGLVSVYILWEAMRLGAPARLLLEMASRVAVDLIIGYVPGAGDLFDVFYKANQRNVTLLRAHFEGDAGGDAWAHDAVPTRGGQVARHLLAGLLALALLVAASVPFIALYVALR